MGPGPGPKLGPGPAPGLGHGTGIWDQNMGPRHGTGTWNQERDMGLAYEGVYFVSTYPLTKSGFSYKIQNASKQVNNIGLFKTDFIIVTGVIFWLM